MCTFDHREEFISLLLYLFLQVVEILSEFDEFFVFQTLFDMEGQRQVFKRVSAKCFVVLAHVPEESLLVA